MTAYSAGILWFKEVSNDDTFSAGIYGVKLGEMMQEGFPIPNGFIITSHAYFYFLRSNKLIAKITPLLTTINYDHPDSLMQVSSHIKTLVMQASIPEEIITEVAHAYNTLVGAFKNSPVRITASPTGSPQPIQFQTYDDIHGETNLLLKIKQTWASNFEPQALVERHSKHIDHFAVGTAITVQQELDAQTHGIMMTIDPVGNNKNHLIIEALGSDGTLDHYAIDKKTDKNELREEHRENTKLKLTEEQIRELADLGKKLETFLYFPQEIIWVIQKNAIFLTGTKPLHFHETKEEDSAIATKLPLILKALPASRGIASGIVTTIHESGDLTKIHHGEILLLDSHIPLSPNIIKKVAGLIIKKGSRTSAVALMAREYGIPTVITQNPAADIIKQNMVVTIDGTKGWIYKGSHTQPAHNRTATKIYATLSNSAQDTELTHDVDGIMIENVDVLESLAQTSPAHPIIYRMTDPKSEDANQLLGFRGTYKSLQQPELLKNELEMLKQIYKNNNRLTIILPFTRSVSELITIKHHLSDYGLIRGLTCKLWMSIETPSNVHLLEEFIRAGIDGVSIDSDTLTMLFTGTTKDNSDVAHAYDALDQSVLSAMEQVIKTTHKHGITSSIHGHSILHHSSLIEKLVRWGITSIAVPSSEVDQIKKHIIEAEKILIDSRST